MSQPWKATSDHGPDCKTCQEHPEAAFSPLDQVVLGTVASVTPVDPARDKRIAFLEAARPKLVDYLKMKLEASDWHGVQDAASDLRDLDSELEGLRY